MTFYNAHTLSDVYEILRSLDGPVALFDFFSGELGHETLYGLACALKFHKDHADNAQVVALTWKGTGILYQPASSVQIELDDVGVATMDSAVHRGEGRYRWALAQGHVEAIDAIPGIVARFGPAFWQGGKGWWLQGNVESKRYLEAGGYTTNWTGATQMIADFMARTGFRFNAGERMIARPYISLFDRNDKMKPKRNTYPWHFELARQIADECHLGLVVLKGWYARPSPVPALEFHAKHRDLRTFINVVANSILHLSPPSGTSELAMVTGCNLASLAHYPHHGPLSEILLKRRGFEYIEAFEPDDAGVAAIRKFVKK